MKPYVFQQWVKGHTRKKCSQAAQVAEQASIQQQPEESKTVLLERPYTESREKPTNEKNNQLQGIVKEMSIESAAAKPERGLCKNLTT